MNRILVVYDNPANLTQVREILQGEYEVSAVTSGEQALRFLDKREADVILLDLFMAGMDGLQTLRCIREDKKYTGKVMIITALSDSKIEAESITPAPKAKTISENLCEIFLNMKPIRAPNTVAPPTPNAVNNTICIYVS